MLYRSAFLHFLLEWCVTFRDTGYCALKHLSFSLYAPLFSLSLSLSPSLSLCCTVCLSVHVNYLISSLWNGRAQVGGCHSMRSHQSCVCFITRFNRHVIYTFIARFSPDSPILRIGAKIDVLKKFFLLCLEYSYVVILTYKLTSRNFQVSNYRNYPNFGLCVH